MRNDKGYLAGEVDWNYIGLDEAPPSGTKLNLLTEGGMQVVGEYRPDGGFIAWARLIKRNPRKEALQKFVMNSDVKDHHDLIARLVRYANGNEEWHQLFDHVTGYSNDNPVIDYKLKSLCNKLADIDEEDETNPA